MTIPTKLQTIATEVATGKHPRRKVRTLIRWFGYHRRWPTVVSAITQALQELQLRTSPDFRDVDLDAFVSFSPLDQPATGPHPKGTSEDQGRKPEDLGSSTSGAALRVGMLVRPSTPVATVKYDSTVREATTLMMANDYSQLPVTQNGYQIDGIISWRSIGRSLSQSQPCERVGDCLDDAYSSVLVPQDTPFLDAVEKIAKEEVVLVCDATRKLSGIITASDLSTKYHELAAPFLLLNEIEERLRSLIDRTFSPEEIGNAKDPLDESREVNGAADLTFGEYIRLLEPKGDWPRLGIKAHRTQFLRLLSEANEVRNDVMHFSPDEPKTESVTQLRTLLIRCGID